MTTPASTAGAIYRDATRPIPERVQDLLERMTLDEKIAQLGSAWVYELLDDSAFAPEKAYALMAHGIGQITRIGGASSVRPAEFGAAGKHNPALSDRANAAGHPGDCA